MKPTTQFDKECFPRTDCFFQSGVGGCHGYWPNDDGESRRYNLGREYLIEAARERAKEMAVFGIILFAAAWPVILMIIEVVRFYRAGR